jgi:hypothetical protein
MEVWWNPIRANARRGTDLLHRRALEAARNEAAACGFQYAADRLVAPALARHAIRLLEEIECRLRDIIHG